VRCHCRCGNAALGLGPNLAGDGTHTYVHNALGQLVSVTTPSARCRTFMARRESGTLFP